MVCIYCGGDTHVKNSRLQKKANQVWRRRACVKCGAIFSTLESPDFDRSIVVQKASHLEPFSRDILFISIYDSLKHRQTAVSDATAVTATVIAKLLKRTGDAQLDRAQIVKTAQLALARFDKAAAVHYAAFHQS